MVDSKGVLYNSFYYDEKGRVVQTRSTGLIGYDHDFFAYNFTGQPTKKKHLHKAYSSNEIQEEYVFAYDLASRPTTTTHSFNGQTLVQLSEISYDELGRAKQKTLHGGIESIHYTYNVRGWLKDIQSNEFVEQLKYEAPTESGSIPCYNGNISQINWTTTQKSTQEKTYLFQYDQLNRLTDAHYLPNETFSERIKQYDKNGNIMNLERVGYVMYEGARMTGLIDNLYLQYNGNQLKNVSEWPNSFDYICGKYDFKDKEDATVPTEYLYDTKGNQIADFNKGVAWIRYNSLNLPSKVQFSNGNTAEYFYDAMGVKRNVVYKTAINDLHIPIGDTQTSNNANNIGSVSQTAYCGSYIYEDKILRKVLTPEGYLNRIKYTKIDPVYKFKTNYDYWQYSCFEKDHLGNTRVQLLAAVLPVQGSKNYTVAQATDYYPFGMEHENPDEAVQNPSGNVVNDYLYNGKEMDRMHGLNMLDYGARWYDPAIGRWHILDAMAEGAYEYTPYRYAFNNPIRYIDPDGNFELDKATIKQYPKIAYYLKNNIQSIISNKRIMAGLLKFGQLSANNVADAVKWGKGPKIVASSMDGKNGSFTPFVGSNILNINKNILNKLETALITDSEETLLFVASTILHEYTHFGDDQDGVDYPGEEGELFEEFVYGFDIDCLYDAKIIIDKYKKRHEEIMKKQEEKEKARGAATLISNINNIEAGTYVWDGNAWVKQ
ncbi:MAG: hypothetical protein PHV20_02200 [Bacteroidales bacterium]|nr:hypothetical protein [Bacteroidales bacterium]